MPNKSYSFGTTEDKVAREPNRTTFILQNVDAADDLYVADTSGRALSDGLRITPGGVFEQKKADGQEPEKAWYIIGSAAGVDARIFTDYADYPKVETFPQTGAPAPGAPGIPGQPGAPAPSCIASAVVPFTPLLDVFRHIRSSCPMRLRIFYYKIPYPNQHIWSWLHW